MSKKILIYLVGISLVIFLVSCAKLPETKAPPSVPTTLAKFGMEPLKLSDSTLLKWGNLIGVSNVTPVWVILYFQDKEGNVYLVWYNIQENKYLEEYRVMKRK